MHNLVMKCRRALSVAGVALAANCAMATCAVAGSAVDGGDWRPLFAGDLSDAVYDSAVWSKDADGCLTAAKDVAIWTRDDYARFELSCEYNLEPAANSGILIYCSNTKNWIPNAVEIQLLDNDAPKWKGLDPRQANLSFFGHQAPTSNPARPAGEWNCITVRADGKKISVSLNGVLVNECDLSIWTDAKKLPNGDKIPPWLSRPWADLETSGKIGLQGRHAGAGVRFRNVRIRSIPPTGNPVRIDVKAGESLVAVRDRVRALPETEKANGVEVVLAEGEYLMEDGMELTAKDGGVSASVPVVWRSEKPGAARIFGSRRIPASLFRKVVNPAFLARLPEAGRGKVYAADLSKFCTGAVAELPDSFCGAPPPPFVFFDGKLGTMACWPNGGEWVAFSNRVDIGVSDDGDKRAYRDGAFVFDDPRASRWDFSKGVWLNGYLTHDWDNRCIRAVSYGPENGTNGVMRLRGSTVYGVMAGTWGRKERRFRVFNVLEELDEEGEWYFDREKKVLFVIPPGGAIKDGMDIRLALSEKPLLAGRGVKNISFEGIAFCCAYGGFARFRDVEDAVFSGCLFSGTIQDGVKIDYGVRVRFHGCEVVHCGMGGLLFGSYNWRKAFKRSDSSVENCRIHDYAILRRTYACAIELREICGFTVRGNEMFDAPHMAMRYESNDTLIESNDIHHVVMETGDAGALYSGRDWTTQGNVLRYNFIHDIGSGTTSAEGDDVAVSGTNVMGMYFDDCDCGDEVYGNVFCNVGRGIMVGGGRDHPVRNNVFINCRMGLSIDCRGYRWKNFREPGPDGKLMLEAKALKQDYTSDAWAARYPRLANIMNDHPLEPLYNPVEGNTFIDCAEILRINEVIKFDGDGTAPGIFSRMAPIRDNTVIYTRGAKALPGFKPVEPRIASGFRVVGE